MSKSELQGWTIRRGYRGFYNRWDSDTEATYLRGQLDGVIVRFWLNGNIMEETDYSEGEIIGEARLYDERGKRILDDKEKSMVGTLTKVFRGE